jgi:ABC-2 type transport system ATP-binding protein
VSWGVDRLRVRLGGRDALAGVTLAVPPGRITGVVGADGAGKTTLLRALAGAIGADGGVVRRPPAEAVGYLPAGSGTYPDLTVGENLAFTAAAYRLDRTAADARTAELLRRAGLDDARDRLGRALSGGMRQKLGVVRALLPRPDLVVLDEPTTGVDPVSRTELWRLVAGAAAEGAAVVVATSYLDEASRVDHLLVLDGGRTLAEGTPADIRAAVPGVVRTRSERPAGDDRRRAWRRGVAWRVWDPDGRGGDGSGGAGGAGSGDGADLDLQDAVTVLALRQELAS